MNESLGAIVYSGDKIHEIYYDDGTIFKEFVYTDGNGIFYLNLEHNLYWEDYKENKGKDGIFIKSE